MHDLGFYLAAALYGMASTVFLAHLAGSERKPARWGPGLLVAAAVFHAAFVAARWAIDRVAPLAGIREALSTLALLMVLGFLAVHFIQRRIDVVGAFLTPVALVLLFAARVPAERPASHGALVVLHVASTLLGTAAFTLAFAMSLAYLLQERQVKRKQLAGLFRRLPPLTMLDDLGTRCVAVGLPALTLGILTGVVVSLRSTQGSLPWQRFVGMGAWALFAAVLLLRRTAGWRGRRAAIGTILGFAGALVVLLGYYLRGSTP